MHPGLFLPVEVFVQQSEVVRVMDFGENCAKFHPSQANDNISSVQRVKTDENTFDQDNLWALTRMADLLLKCPHYLYPASAQA